MVNLRINPHREIKTKKFRLINKNKTGDSIGIQTPRYIYDNSSSFGINIGLSMTGNVGIRENNLFQKLNIKEALRMRKTTDNFCSSTFDTTNNNGSCDEITLNATNEKIIQYCKHHVIGDGYRILAVCMNERMSYIWHVFKQKIILGEYS
jgi:hypothetical protein